MSDKLKAAEAMVRYGGGFASALAKAWFAADPLNRATLEGAFRDLFLEYAALADRAAEGALVTTDRSKIEVAVRDVLWNEDRTRYYVEARLSEEIIDAVMRALEARAA